MSCLLATLCTTASAASFRRGPDLVAAHAGQAAALLNDGRVMLAGSTNASAAQAVDLYDPARNRWQAGPPLSRAEAGATLTTLPNGKVLLVGQGRQVFDPVANTWATVAPGTTVSLRRHTATLLATGQVMIAGGERQFGETFGLELYDPVANTWMPWGHLDYERQRHAAVQLASGKVLFAGGRRSGAAMSNVELYDPQFGAVDSSGSMLVARSGLTLTLLPGGKVLAAGGDDGGVSLASCEIYDPATGGWQFAAAMNAPRTGHAATVLPDGRVLVSGGESAPGTAVPAAEIYDPAGNGWIAAGNLAVTRAGHSAVPMPNGSVLLAGGTGDASASSSSEWFDPATASSVFDRTLPSLRTGATATWLPPGKVLVVGGGFDADYDAFADVFDVATATWSSLGLAARHTRHTQTVLRNGRVLLAGGLSGGTPIPYAETVNGTTMTSSGVASMSVPRYLHAATLMPDGTTLVTGGYTSGGVAVASAELYRPGVDTWTPRAPMNAPRGEHAATLLDDGRVLVSGGRDAAGQALDSAEVYDPAADRWTTLAAPGIARYAASATLLRNGSVLVAGGLDNAGTPLARADVFDPRQPAWSRAPDMALPRAQHTTTLLPSGQVMLAGGRSGASGGTRGVEIYTPEVDRWSPAADLAFARNSHSAVLLPSGHMLVVYGYAANWVPFAEYYDPGLAPDPARQPRLYSADLLSAGHGTLRASGNGFQPAFGGNSSGAGAGSNFPLLQVQRIDNGQMRFVRADADLPFSGMQFSGRPLELADFPAGPVQVRAWVNGVPSAAVNATVASVPAPVAAPTATGGVLRATVAFAPPGDDGGTAVTGYRVTAAPGGAQQSCLAPCNNVEFASLPPGVYAFAASAVNAAGTAAASPPSNSVVVQARSSVTLASGVNPSRYGDTVTFTATASGLAPGGTMTFRADGNALCTGVALTAGVAQCNTQTLAGGLHAITASYSGDAGNTASQSATLQQQVNTVDSNAALVSSVNPSTYGDTVVLTATITTELLGGHVGFYDGATPLCANVNLVGGTASCTVTDFAVGTHAITARYGGDDDTGASVSFALAQQVLALPTTTSVETACARAFTANQPFTLRASIATASLGGVPAGSVDFVADTGATLCHAVALTDGTASCTTTDIAAPAGQGQGTVAIRARYSGDAINAGGSSPDLTVTVFDPADVLLRNGFEAATPGCPVR
ncbi:kelch repeat-containing protein [Tahibacter soli]|uniref:Kelch repeat-containing protein n=1 Tax=Tahibacter soli TaxID=2983605 RepID=A0A9X3YSM0_9GAMM|nr:kelch repeat-containing protein [Tahibacter soli]MDC8016238.1 kelch repeat-containing protein [Tahibacter soli]